MSDAIHCRHRLPSPETAGFCDVTDAETGEVRLALDSLQRPCPIHGIVSALHNILFGSFGQFNLNLPV